MDSHIHTAPDLDRTGLSAARLPGEPDPDSFMPPRDDEPLPSTGRSRTGFRSGLLSAAVFVLIPAVALGAFIMSPYNHFIPVPAGAKAEVHRLATETGLSRDQPVLAPAASLASIKLPARPDTVVLDPYQPKSRGEALTELLSMRPDTKAAPEAVKPNVKPVSAARVPAAQLLPPSHESSPDFTPGEPGSLAGQPAAQTWRPSPPPERSAAVTGAARADITGSVISAATGPASAISGPTADSAGEAAPVPIAAPLPAAGVNSSARAPDAPAAVASLPSDPVQQAILLRPAPMTEERQIEVLQLVTQMATMLRDLQTENAALRSDVSRRSGEVSARLRDFERRINLAEARRAVDAAAAPRAAEPLAPAQPTTPTNPPMVRSIAVTSADTVLPAEAAATRKRYRVQAASPGLALLAEIDRGGGDGAQVQVVVGDALPGWGKVKSVAQRGTSWVVATEHGNID